MKSYFPIGISDFREMRELRLHYVDKTQMIAGILDEVGTKVLLLPRPRRFGKTLNLSMLRYFFEKPPPGATAERVEHLFHDLAIWKAGEEYLEHFQAYPVIHTTFKGLKADSLADWEGMLGLLLQELYAEHIEILELDLQTWEREQIESILYGRASNVVQRSALKRLIGYLHRLHGRPVVVLIDEYDAPIHTAWTRGFADEVVSFFRTFLGDGLKDTTHVFKAVITGILRVARESIFWDLNNLGVYTLLDRPYNDCFGFTETELRALLEQVGMTGQYDILRKWYDGYLFGGEVVYNPWSVMNHLRRGDSAPQAYWLNTSSNDLIRVQLQKRAWEIHEDISRLLSGEAVERPINPGVVLSDLDHDETTFWSLLLFSGYLKAEPLPVEPGEMARHALSIPNREVREIYLQSFRGWLRQQLPGREAGVEALQRALFRGDGERVEELLSYFAGRMLSYHDTGRPEPEKLYQGFVVGLLASLDGTHRVLSNRESGKGRPDLLIVPRSAGQPGVAMELKVARAGRDLEAALEEAEAQIARQDYTADLRAAGAAPIHTFAVAFDGKTVRVH